MRRTALENWWIGELSWIRLQDTRLIEGFDRTVEGSGSVLELPFTASSEDITWVRGSSTASLHLESQTEPISTV